MEEQEKLKTGIGTKEPEKLGIAKVRILGIKFEPVKFGTKEQEKVNFVVKHPDKDESINLSKAKVERKDKLKFIGLWYSLDEDGNILKNSAVADVMRFLEIVSLEEATGKEIDTAQDEDGYLCLKAYN